MPFARYAPCVSFFALLAAAPVSAADDWHERFAKFADGDGQDMATVFKALGPPDHVQTVYSTARLEWSDARSVWLYGVDSHDGLALKGRVYFNERGGAVGVVGEKTRNDEVLKVPNWEPHLRRLWELRTGSDASTFDPLRFINAVNLLKEHSKEDVFRLLDEYCRLTEFDEQEWIPLALRYTFKLPLKMDHPDLEPLAPKEDADASGLPVTLRYPLLVVQGVPFVINAPKGAGGRVPDAESVLAKYKKAGELDRTELRPTSELARTRELIMKSTVWKKLRDDERVDKEEPPSEVLSQCAKLARTAFATSWNVRNHYNSDLAVAERYSEFEKQLAANPLEWSPLVGCYIRRNTQRYIPPSFINPSPEVHVLAFPTVEVKLVLKRVEPEVVEASLRVQADQADVAQKVVAHLTTPDGRRRTLKAEVKGGARRVGSSTGEYFEIDRDAPIEVQISINDRVLHEKVVVVRE
jgi:hypothetical protein